MKITPITVRAACTTFDHLEQQLILPHRPATTVTKHIERRRFFSSFNGFDILLYEDWSAALRDQESSENILREAQKASDVLGFLKRSVDMMPEASLHERLQRCRDYQVKLHHQDVVVYTVHHILPDNTTATVQTINPDDVEIAMLEAYHDLRRVESGIARKLGFTKLPEAVEAPYMQLLLQYFSVPELIAFVEEHFHETLEHLSTLDREVTHYVRRAIRAHNGLYKRINIRDMAGRYAKKIYRHFYQHIATLMTTYENIFETYPTAWVLSTTFDAASYHQTLQHYAETLKQETNIIIQHAMGDLGTTT